jgi:hypothetical protein
VVSVAATDSQDGLAHFSNFGEKTVDLGSPGLMIRSSIPFGGSGYMSGTSMAAPHVAGAAAVLWGLNSDANFWQIREALIKSALPVSALAGKTVSGGRLDLPRALDYLPTAPAGPIPTTDPAQPSDPTPPTPDPTPTPSPTPTPDPTPTPTPAPTIPSKPKLLVPPLVSGSRNAPSELTCEAGSWENVTSTSVEWFRQGLFRGSGPKYQTGADDVGDGMTCRVTAFNSSGKTTVYSETVPIGSTRLLAPKLVSSPKALIKAGKKMRCTTGVWRDASLLSVRWLVAGRSTAVASLSTWRVPRRYRGKRVRCQVKATGYWAGRSTTATSAAKRVPKSW